MAQQVGIENLSGRTTLRRYELFVDLAGALLIEADRRLLHDALFFDYCGSEMPLMGKLPSFVVDRQQECTWPGRAELPRELELPQGSRVKAFRYVFLRDYRGPKAQDGPVKITFVYVSAEGRGLKVLAV
jgi:anaerobic magnesium-protoporphyrin IX monomethyl ester cyclase